MTNKAASPPILNVAYVNRAHPDLEMEFFLLTELVRRVPPDYLAHFHRLPFHHLMLFTAGRGVHCVDFERIPCRRGAVLHARPGQIQRFEPRAGDRKSVV